MTIKKSSMKSLIAYEQIRDMILTGAKLPGTRLILTELEAELGIGRGPIREALMRLDRTGLVKNVPYKGALVASPPKRREVLHIYDLRIAVEVKLATEAMEHLTEVDFAVLENLHAEMRALPSNHYQFDREFHNYLYEAARLPHLYSISKALILSVESVLNIYRREEAYCIKCNSEHFKIIEALKTQDPEQLRLALTININSGLAIIKNTYNKILGTPFE